MRSSHSSSPETLADRASRGYGLGTTMRRHFRLLSGGLSLGLLTLLHGCSSGEGVVTATGGLPSTGGAATSTGGSATGGTITGGTAASTGGANTGGSNSTGGSSTGGVTTGGMSTGGENAGGNATGGTPAGGSTTGGQTSGTGGAAATGGSDSAGAAGTNAGAGGATGGGGAATGGGGGGNAGAGGKGGQGNAGAGGASGGAGGNGGAGGAGKTAVAMLMPTSGNQLTGTGTFTQSGQNVTLVIQVTNCPAGGHASHIHLNKNCGNNGDDAGAHWVPQGEVIPEITCAADGTGMATVTPPAGTWTIGSGTTDVTAHALMVHVGNNASPGGRLACGLINAQ